MKSNQFFFLTYLPLILIGSLVNPNSASASELAYGKIDISFNSGVYFQNNVVDFVNPVGQSNIFGDQELILEMAMVILFLILALLFKPEVGLR